MKCKKTISLVMATLTLLSVAAYAHVNPVQDLNDAIVSILKPLQDERTKTLLNNENCIENRL